MSSAPGVALVTGAGSGMGQLAARRLAAAGASVAAVDVDDDGLAATVGRAPTMRSWWCDVSDADAVERVVKEVESALGPIDRLVHAAGICLPSLLVEQPVDEIDRTIAVNFLGTAYMVKAVLPGMHDRRRGDIVAFASLAGWLPSVEVGKDVVFTGDLPAGAARVSLHLIDRQGSDRGPLGEGAVIPQP